MKNKKENLGNINRFYNRWEDFINVFNDITIIAH